MTKKIRLLIVDDSAVVRKFMTDCLAGTSIEVIATAMDPYIAADKIKNLAPDVITLDIEMPRMNGLDFLKKLMMVHPMPVIMVSSFTDRGATETIKALEYGAADFILKPKMEEGEEAWKRFRNELVEKIEAVSHFSAKRRSVTEKKTISAPTKQCETCEQSSFIVAIGASTGGTEVVERILTGMKPGCYGMVITQHMPPKFTEAFANRINSLSVIKVKEAADGDPILRGCAYIAPGGTQMLVRRRSDGYYIEVNDDPPRNRHKPSVDVLFSSVAETAGAESLGVILTGMGNDGAAGLKEMKTAGAMTIAQDEESCVVFGMPREAIRNGAVSKVLNIEQIEAYIASVQD